MKNEALSNHKNKKAKSTIIKDPAEKKKLFPFLKSDDEDDKKPDKYKNHSPNGNLTFIGVFNKYFDEISKNWTSKENTLIPYSDEYVKTVLPKLDEAVKLACQKYPEQYSEQNTPLSIKDYSGDIFLSALELIRTTPGKISSEEQMDSYLRFYRRVVEVAFEHGECPNYLYGTRRTRSKKTPGHQESFKKLLPKSLSPLMNAIIFYALTVAPEKMPGEWVGLFLMYAFGLRNNESVGIQYMDLDSVRGQDILWVYTSAKGRHTTAQKAKGKTKNAYRGIIAAEVAVEIIYARRLYIEKYVQAQHPDWDPEKVRKEVDEYPIACRDNHYQTWITPAQLTDAGRDLFSRIHCEEFDEDDFYLAFRASLDKDLVNRTGFDFRDPTAYLFRREFGTVLKILGYNKGEREFLMGHLIENSVFSRNDFLNSPRLQEQFQKMKQRPLFNHQRKNPVTVAPDITVYERTVLPNDVFRILSGNAKHILISIAASEPFDDHFEVRPLTSSSLDSEFICRNNHEPANVISVYQAVMKSAYDSLDKEKIKKLITLPWST